MTEADLRAMREACGITRQELAGMLEVSSSTVKKWERGEKPVPQDAVDLVLSLFDRHEDVVQAAVDAFLDAHEDTGVETATITYFRGQDQYDAHGRDPGSYHMANANARAAAERIVGLGFEVEFRYPDEGAVRTPGSRY